MTNRPSWSRPKQSAPRSILDGNDRMHLDLYVESEEELVAEVDRLVSLGARQADRTYPEGAAFVGFEHSSRLAYVKP